MTMQGLSGIPARAPAQKLPPAIPEWRRVLRYFWRSKSALLGAILTVLFLVVAVAGPPLMPYDPNRGTLSDRLEPPSMEHPFGTDANGRDLLTRVVYGARASMWIGLMSTLIALVAGTFLGLVAAYYGGWWDTFAVLLVDVLLTFPTLVLAIALLTALGNGINNLIIAVGVSMLPLFARLARATLLSVRSREYVTAAECLGAPGPRVILRHLLPNTLGPLVVQSTLSVGLAVLSAASLSFLGLGVQPPAPEWGSMLSQAREYMRYAPHYIIFPGAALALFVLAFNLMGDGLQDVLDPKLRKSG